MKTFLTTLYKYPSINSLAKLRLIAPKYINNNINYIHITGTNGKGSVARLIQMVMYESGSFAKVGLFTSPHIANVNERIMINDKAISDKDLIRINNLIIKDINDYQLGFFAILTLIALIYFQEQIVSWVVLEVGIGGKYDTTNIINAMYAVITSIGKDHQDLLGNSKKAILKQKLGIVKPQTKTLFISGNINNNLKRYLKNNKYVPIYSPKLKKQPYYVENKILAQTVLNNAFPQIANQTITTIINNSNIRFRFEKVLIANKTVYFDVAHNVDGIKAVKKALKINKIKPEQIIFSCLTTKTPGKLLAHLRSITTDIIVCKNSNKLTISGQTFNFDNMIKNNSATTILITGSCYFLADVYNYLWTNRIAFNK